MHEIIETYVVTARLDGIKIEAACNTEIQLNYYHIYMDSDIFAYGSIMLYNDRFVFHIHKYNLQYVKDFLVRSCIECYIVDGVFGIYIIYCAFENPNEMVNALVRFEETLRNNGALFG